MTKAQKLAELDAKFNSPQNEASGALKLADYMARRSTISAELEPTVVGDPPAAKPPVDPDNVTTAFLQKALELFADLVLERLAADKAAADAAADASAKRFRVDLDSANARLALALVQTEALNKHNEILLERTTSLHDRCRKLEEQLK